MSQLSADAVWNLVDYVLTARITKHRVQSARTQDPAAAAQEGLQAAALDALRAELVEARQQTEAAIACLPAGDADGRA